LNSIYNSIGTVAGLGFGYAEIDCTKLVKHAGHKNQKREILKKTHTPFGRSVQAHSPKLYFISLSAKPHSRAS